MSDLNAENWPNTPVPISAEWVNRCLAAIQLADPVLWIEEASAIAVEMSTQPVYRRLPPEAAVLEIFGPPKKFTGW